MRNTGTLEDAALTQGTNEPQPEVQELEPIALVPAEPDVIEGEVIVIEPEEETADHLPPKQKPYWFLVPFTIFCCLVFLAGSYILPLLTPTATITIIPVEQTITTTAPIQVPGRALPPITLIQSTSVKATGYTHQDATRAVGTITFYNGSFTPQPIAQGTILTGHDRVQVITDQAAIIPAGNPPVYGHASVSAHTRIAGEQGNIPAYDINQACCANAVLAKNTEAFTGGAAARNARIVTRVDINNAVTSLLIMLDQSEDAALQAQLQPGEALIPPSCTPTVSSSHKPGDEATEVQITISEACGGFASVAAMLYAHATQLITAKSSTMLGATYSLIGDIQVNIIHATITDPTRGIASIVVKIDATYVYQLSPDEKQQLVQLIAGKTKQQAINTLMQFPGIQAASIHLAAGNTTLPADPNHIHIIVMYQTS